MLLHARLFPGLITICPLPVHGPERRPKCAAIRCNGRELACSGLASGVGMPEWSSSRNNRIAVRVLHKRIQTLAEVGAISAGRRAVINRPTRMFMHRRPRRGHPLLPHSARLHRSVGLPVGHADCGRTCPREGIGAAQCAGKLIPVGRRGSGGRPAPRIEPAATSLENWWPPARRKQGHPTGFPNDR